MPTRLLHIIDGCDHVGAKRQMSLLTEGLQDQEYNVHVCCLSKPGLSPEELVACNAPSTLIERRWRYDPRALFQLRRLLIQEDPEIIHTWSPLAEFYARCAILGRGLQSSVFSTDQSKKSFGWTQRLVHRFLTHDKQIYIRHGLPALQSKHSGQLTTGKMVSVSWAAKQHPMLPSTSLDKLLEELNLPSTAHLVVTVGHGLSYQRLKQLIWTACMLENLRSDICWVIIGRAPQHRLIERYCRKIRSRQVIFLDRDQALSRILDHTQCFVSASDSPGQGSALLQAMASGVPVIATDIASHREIVVPNESGLLVPAGDRGELARWINEVLDDTALAARLAAGGKVRAESHFPVSEMVQQYRQLYRRAA